MLKTLTKLNPASLLGRLVRLPLRLVPPTHIAKVRGGINKGARWIVGSSNHGCWLGTYENDKQALVSRVVHPGMVVWDVGANAGFYTLAFSHLVGRTGRVYAFEPFAENVNNLLKHVRLNGLENTTVVQAALVDQTGLARFSIAASNSMGCISEEHTPYVVPTYAVDEFLRYFPDACPQLLKIDVEGAEAGLLSGASQLLNQFGPAILLALHGETQCRECREILVSHGYRLYYLDSSAADTLPFRSDEIYALKSKPL
jgi:FkbM family methyltransferase